MIDSERFLPFVVGENFFILAKRSSNGVAFFGLEIVVRVATSAALPGFATLGGSFVECGRVPHFSERDRGWV